MWGPAAATICHSSYEERPLHPHNRHGPRSQCSDRRALPGKFSPSEDSIFRTRVGLRWSGWDWSSQQPQPTSPGSPHLGHPSPQASFPSESPLLPGPSPRVPLGSTGVFPVTLEHGGLDPSHFVTRRAALALSRVPPGAHSAARDPHRTPSPEPACLLPCSQV